MKLIPIVFLSLFLMATSLNDARKANSAFEQGNYAEAAELYQQAISQDPDNPHLHFNLARTLYELGQNDAATEAYDRYKSLTELPVEKSYADYNKGRMLTDQAKYQEAVDYFREALRNNPNDADAKFNYELALQKQQEQEEQQEQDPDSESGEGEDDQENSDQQNDQQDQDQDQDQDSESEQQPGDQDQEESDSQNQPEPLEMTPEEAQNILDALEQLERELLESQKKESTEPPSGNEKDW
tara:strand:- start:2867 stop:3589 length:723 start_codon:yes stop_codon:yes gene_type:complete